MTEEDGMDSMAHRFLSAAVKVYNVTHFRHMQQISPLRSGDPNDWVSIMG